MGRHLPRVSTSLDTMSHVLLYGPFAPLWLVYVRLLAQKLYLCAESFTHLTKRTIAL